MAGSASGPEVPLPVVSVAAEAAQWTKEKVNSNARRHNWPIRRDVAVDLRDFVKFMQGRALSAATDEIHLRGARCFFALLEISSERFSLPTVFVVLYQENLASLLFDLPVLSIDFSWTREIVKAASLLCESLVQDCGRRNFAQASKCIRSLKSEVFEAKKRFCHKAKKLEAMSNKTFDAERLSKLPPVPVLKEAVTRAMVDLRSIDTEAEKRGEISDLLRRAARIAMAGVLYCNGFAGRSNEWVTLTRTAMSDALASGADHVVCQKHKTMWRSENTWRRAPERRSRRS